MIVTKKKPDPKQPNFLIELTPEEAHTFRKLSSWRSTVAGAIIDSQNKDRLCSSFGKLTEGEIACFMRAVSEKFFELDEEK
jgi:hypothetical protein